MQSSQAPQAQPQLRQCRIKPPQTKGIAHAYRIWIGSCGRSGLGRFCCDDGPKLAAGLTTRPAGVLNNWGYSKLTCGDFSAAEHLFSGAQRKYTLPFLPLTQIERAQLLHTLGLTALRQGDLDIAKSLLREAIETHPQHFDEAMRALGALEAG